MTTSMFVLARALVAIAFARLSRGILIVATIPIALAIAAIWSAAHPVNKHDERLPRWPLAYSSAIG